MTTAERTYLTGFGDEIDPNLDVQLSVMRRLGVEALDLRTAFGKNVLKLSDEEVDLVAEKVAAHGLRIQTVGSPVNTAFAAITPPGDVSKLYTIDLSTGAATLVGTIGKYEQGTYITAIAVISG